MTTPASSTSSPVTHRDLVAGNSLCLGGNVFGWTVDEAGSREILDAFVAGGGTFIDTADVYSSWAPGNVGGESEHIIGRWLADLPAATRATLVVATKVGSPMPEGTGLAPEYVAAAAERSRERLGVEAIDILYAHRPDPATPVVDTLRALDALVRAGTVRSIGLSNYDAAQLAEALAACDEHGLARPVVLQPKYNLVDRGEYEGALQELCVREGIAVAPYFALAAGFLTGKYREGGPLPATPRAQGTLAQFDDPRSWSRLAALERVAARHDATPAQVALAWLTTRPGVTSPIASGTTPDHVRDLLAAARIELDEADLALLDE